MKCVVEISMMYTSLGGHISLPILHHNAVQKTTPASAQEA